MRRASPLLSRVLIIAGLTLLLPDCGGGSSDSTPMPASYSVGGMVSGLSGSGLVLENGGEQLPVTHDGAFTFATTAAAGNAYSVTVATPPSGPSQNCSVSQASGMLGNANVTDVAVTCTTTGVANAKLSGTYRMVSFAYPGPWDYGGDRGEVLTLTFDGAGNFTGTDVENVDGSIASTGVAGTYVVADGGTLSITLAGTAALSGSVSNDGTVLVASQTAAGYAPSILVGLKQGAAPFSNTGLSGSYVAGYFDDAGAGDRSGLLALSFDGSGGFTGTDTLNDGGTVSSTPVAGTYNIAVDGGLSVSIDGGATFSGGLTAGGSAFVASDVTAGEMPHVLIGLQQSLVNPSNGTLSGPYAAVRYEFGSTADSGYLSAVSADGSGNFTGTETANQGTVVTSAATTGTYAVGADGSLGWAPAGGTTLSGALAPGARVLASTQAGQAPAIEVAIARSAAYPVSPSRNAVGIVCQVVAASTRAVYDCATPQPLTIRNLGMAGAYLYSITITGPDAAFFKQTNDCPAALGFTQACTVTVHYAGPTNVSAANLHQRTVYVASLLIQDGPSATSASGVAQAVSLQAVLPPAS